MRRAILPCCLGAAAIALAVPARAEMPIFAATCPIGGNVDADRTGTVRVGGNVAAIEAFNANYYEARHDGVTYSISHEGGGRGLIVSFSASGGRNGRCTILSAGPAPAGGDAAAGVALLPEEDIFVVSLADPDGVLNVRNAPRASGALVGRLANATTLANVGGCTISDGAQWCEVQAERGGLRGWVMARFLALPGPAVREDTATADDGGGAMAGSAGPTVPVRFAAGTSGAELAGDLLPGRSMRYALGARAGQTLDFRLVANGPGMVFRIENPDGSLLVDRLGAERPYRGQLYQSGDHVVTVTNTANGAQSYAVIFGIE